MTTKCYMGLADIDRRQGHFQEAQSQIERALRMQEESLGSMHPSVANGLDVEGLNYFDQHKVDLAMNCFQRALNIRKKLLTAEHPDMLTSLFYVALCQQSIDPGAKSEQALSQSLNALARVLGDKHPTVEMARQLSVNQTTG